VSAKGTLTTLLRPAASLVRRLGPSTRRIWAHACLRDALGAVDASVVIEGTVELHGTRAIRVGRGVYLYRGLYWETRGSGRIDIGDRVVMSRGVHVVAHAGVRIGAGTMIGEYASIRDANHRRDGGPLRDAGHVASPVTIGREVWIGRGAVVLPGVTIGDRAVVGANAVVTRDVPPGAVVGGVPARPLPGSAGKAIAFTENHKGPAAVDTAMTHDGTAEAVLLVAYQCAPDSGSVSQLGWQWFTGMAARRPVTLVTHVRHRQAIESAPDRPRGAQVIYIDTEWFAGPLYRLAKRLFPRSEHAVFALAQLDWFVFDAVALRRLRRERAAGAPWSLVHLVTPVTTAAPTRLHRLGLPLVRGPLNCGLPVPAGFRAEMRDDAISLARARALPWLAETVMGSLQASKVVLVATAATHLAVPRAARARCLPMLENAVDPALFSPAPPLPPPSAVIPLRVAFVGRLVAVKALPLLLRALASLAADGISVHLTVAGDGPMRERWTADARLLGIDASVRWLGAVPRARVPHIMKDCHVFCLPSVRESGGAVLLEAMACGRPVIGLDFGGPAEIVDAQVGWKVDAADADTAVAGIAAALRDVVQSPREAADRGRHGALRVRRHHTWAARMDAAERIYAEVKTAVVSVQPGRSTAIRVAQ
jgi:acetyltransferase-like isoleucine patch superfamily enzyme/glycosyltransferase involved in cell wall biosynthesis